LKKWKQKCSKTLRNVKCNRSNPPQIRRGPTQQMPRIKASCQGKPASKPATVPASKPATITDTGYKCFRCQNYVIRCRTTTSLGTAQHTAQTVALISCVHLYQS
jgi:hypothetical protein